MKHIITSISALFIVFCCFAQGDNSQNWNRSEIQDGLVAKDTYCLFSSIKYGQTIEWINACRSTTHQPCNGQLGYFNDSKQMATIADFISLWYNGEGEPGHKGNDFILWRLTSFMPSPKYIHSTKERFDFLELQIDSLLDYEKNSQWDMNLGAWLELDLNIFHVRMLEKELNNLNPGFTEECKAFEEYISFSERIYEFLVRGKDSVGGSGEPIARSDFYKDRYEMRHASIRDFLFYLSDSIIPEGPVHGEFTPELVNSEYEKYISTLPELEFDYSIEDRQAVLEEERQKWNKWIKTRQDISQSLSPEERKVFERQTHLLCRHQYIILKNRNLGYGFHSASLDEHLLQHSWTDEDILKATDAYTAYFKL